MTVAPCSERNVIAQTAARGVVGAMAMSGLRTVTTGLGMVDETPPEAIAEQRGPRMLMHLPEKQRKAVIEIVHWAYGGWGGAVFGALPDTIRRSRWGGPAYGLALWLTFEVGIAPVLGLRQAKKRRVVERLAFAGDHVLYGLMLSGLNAKRS